MSLAWGEVGSLLLKSSLTYVLQVLDAMVVHDDPSSGIFEILAKRHGWSVLRH